ncbi:ECF transporter S component [uncultured Adlercreutzia sp.]|uniref:ECF transporter S component n=1 Tax=uncultured Adlercreutzia sp. TaxID=875803 RepID=UPI002675DFA4|nr:ECF transporter S component [uncultured Adlercreutzia sp.]
MSKNAYRLVLAALAVLVLGATAVITVQRVSPYVAAVLIIVLAIVPFLISFERSRPDAREVVLMAVLTALAVASRAAFAFVPHFKPMAGVVMIAGIALGPRAGFLVGVLAALASGFLFGQGPWTPFQMLAFGAAGAGAGLLGAWGALPRANLSLAQRVGLAAGGFIFVVLVLGPILDTSTLFLMASSLTPASAAAVYLAGLPVNAVHGAATALTLLLAANPLLGQIARVRRKYGLE